MKTKLLLLCIFFMNILSAQDGVLDTSFGTNGYIVTNHYDANFYDKVLPGGKLLYRNQKKLHVLNTDGSLDTGFGTQGSADLIGTLTGYETLGVLSNGKIIALSKQHSTGVYHISKYNADGSIDTSLGGSGQGFINLNMGELEVIRKFRITSNDNIIIGGHDDTEYGTRNDLVVNRYDKNLVLDDTFNYRAQWGINMGSSNGGSSKEYATDLDIMNSGKIVITGNSSYFSATGYGIISKHQIGLAIIEPNDQHGQPIKNSSVCYDPQHLKSETSLDANDNIYVLSGELYEAVNKVYKLTPNGSRDTTFGINGELSVDVTVSTSPEIKAIFYQILVQPDGKILLSGTTTSTSNRDIIIARFLPSGSIDATFGTNGFIIHDITGPSSNSDSATKLFASDDFSSIYVEGGNSGNRILLKYSNPSILTVSEDNLLKESTTLFPIPVSNYINLRSKNSYFGKGKVVINNIMGKEIYTSSFNKQSDLYEDQINTTNLSKGVYIIKFIIGNKQTFKRFIK